MIKNLLTQVDFAKKLSDDLGKNVSKQNISYYKKQGMLCTVNGYIIKTSGDSPFLKGETISRKDFDDENLRISGNSGELATGKPTILIDYEKSYRRLTEKIDTSHSSNFTGKSEKPNDSTNEYDYNIARARNEHYKAEISRMEAEEKAGKLTSVAEVESDSYLAAARVRDALLEDLPLTLSPTLAVMTDVFKIEELLKNEITKALKALSEKISEEATA